MAACVYPVNEGMEIFTNTKRVQEARKTTLELILSNHDKKCLSCPRSNNCELQAMCKEFGVEDEDRFAGENPVLPIDTTTAHLVRNNNKCILCTVDSTCIYDVFECFPTICHTVDQHFVPFGYRQP